MKDAHLKAVHDDDLKTLLESLGVYGRIEDGQCCCLFCGEKISIDNLGSIISHEGEIKFSCNQDKCLQQIVDIGGDNDDSK